MRNNFSTELRRIKAQKFFGYAILSGIGYSGFRRKCGVNNSTFYSIKRMSKFNRGNISFVLK